MEAISIGHIIITETPGKAEVIIPARKNWISLGIISGVIIFWWFTGGNIAFTALTNHQNIEVYDWVWLCWGIAVILVLIRNLWLMTAVKEIIIFEEDKLTVKKSGHPFVANKIFKLSKARRFAVSENSAEEDNGSIWSSRNSIYMGSGSISFEYGKKIIRFGEGVEEKDANRVLTVLREKKVVNENK